MFERRQRGDAPARRALQVALLDQIRLDHVFDGVALFADAGGDVVQADRAAVKAVDHRFEQFAVHQIEAFGVHVEHDQGFLGNALVNGAVTFDIGIVAHAAQQTVGNARRAA